MISLDYRQARDYVKQASGAGIRPGLARIRRLLMLLGDPQDQKPLIHVAGTNGKGSVCSFLASVFHAAGICAGRYLSPSVLGYREMIQTDGAWIPREDFAECMTKTSNTFVANSSIFGKVYFPRLVMPIADVISNLLRFGIQFGFFLLVYLIYAIVDPTCNAHFTGFAFLFPVLVLILAGLSLGFGTIISSMTTKYRDLQVLFSFLIQLWMYATPIVYPLSQTGSMRFMGVPVHTFMCLNPVTPIIETFKYGFLGCGAFVGWRWLIYSFVFMCLLLGFGIVVFNKVQKSFMDTV